MKAYDILEQAARMATGSPPDPLISKAGAGLINMVLYDMGLKGINFLSDEVSFSHPGEKTVATGGVAMLICTLLGDDAGTASWRAIFEGAKNRTKHNITRIKNTAFGGGAGED